MNKKYLNGMIVLAIIFILLALFGTSNHFLKFYKPSSEKLSNNNSTDDKKNNNKNTDTPTNPTNPDNPTTPENPVEPGKEVEINGYKCTSADCKILDGTSVISERFVFILDGTNNIILYDIKEDKNLYTFTKVIPAGNLYIAQKENLYGLLNVSNTIKEVVSFTFNYIDYNSEENQYTVTTQSNSSYIINEKGEKISPTYVAQIIQYNDKYIITKLTNNEYHIFNFNNREFLTEYINSKSLYIELIGDYVGVITSDYKYVIYDFGNNSKIISEYQLDNGVSDARARINGSKIEIYRGTKVLKTIDL